MNHTQFILGAALLLCAPASADVITWGAPQDTTSAAQVSTNGTLVTAKNCWAQTASSPTVNGVPFDLFAPIGWNNGGWLLNNGSTSGDPDLDAMLDSARVTSFGSGSNPTDWGAIQLDTLGTLTMGNNYEIQVWYSDQRPGNGNNFLNDRVMLMSSAAGAGSVTGGVIQNLAMLTQGPISSGVDADPNNTFGAGDTILGQHVTGTFTRTSADSLYLLVMGIHPVATANLRPHVNAFQIREVTGTGVGTPFCDPANNNNTGLPCIITASMGSGVGADLHLDAGQGPSGQFGYFLVGTSSMDPGLTISNGRLCLGGIGRYNVAGTNFNSIGQFDAGGLMQNAVGTSTTGSGYDVPVTVPITGSPMITSGSTWNFQLWYREPGGNANFSNGLAVTFP